MIAADSISADTQSTLLLSAQLATRAKAGPSPLTAAEYDELARGLHAEGLRPGDLLRPGVATSISALLTHVPARVRERLTPDRVALLLERGGALAVALARWTSAGIWVLSRADATYPSRYKKTFGRSTPPILYGIGPVALLERGGLAVVGSRDPDAVSERYAAESGRWAAGAGVQVVSGAARGVDEGAMHACVEAGGTALGVVAESLLKLSTRRGFREGILAERLTLISAFDPDAGFHVANAMARNRWIYALADRALVVACSEGRGGTWAGALEALKRGVPLYAKTGNPERPGNDALVAHGALAAPDDLSELWRATAPAPPASPAPSAAPAPATEDVFASVAPALVRILHQPMTAKEFAAVTGLVKSQADAWLKRLVADGRARKVKTTYSAASAAGDHPTLF